jgi:hypothetical protein
MFSMTVRLAKILVSWKVRPMPSANTLSGAMLVIRRPPRYTSPASAFAYPVITLNRVVLPDPFGPISPATSPSPISTVQSSSARTPPYALCTPSVRKSTLTVLSPLASGPP